MILRLKRARNPDVVCIERLEHFLREETAHGVTILLAGVRPDTLRSLRNTGFDRWFPVDQVFPEEEEEYSATLRAPYVSRTAGFREFQKAMMPTASLILLLANFIIWC